MAQPLVSIITPCYNSEKFISETILSVQNQSYQNWEMIVVDDCSTDATLSIISEFSKNDSRIKHLQLEKNSGTGVARNHALSKANGSYIAFLDADDLWKPQKLTVQVDYLKKNNLPFAFSYYECINEAGKPLNKLVTAPKTLYYYQLFFCNFIGNLTTIYSVDFFGKIPISNHRKRQDWMLWLGVLKIIKTATPIPESLAYYRIRNNSISASKIALLKYNFGVYRQFHGYNFLLSLIIMIGFLFTQLIIKPWYSKKIGSTKI